MSILAITQLLGVLGTSYAGGSVISAFASKKGWLGLGTKAIKLVRAKKKEEKYKQARIRTQNFLEADIAAMEEKLSELKKQKES